MSRHNDNDRKVSTHPDKDAKAGAADREASPPAERAVDKTGALKRTPTHENSWSKGVKKT